MSCRWGARDALRLIAGDHPAFENWFLHVRAVTLVLGSSGVSQALVSQGGLELRRAAGWVLFSDFLFGFL